MQAAIKMRFTCKVFHLLVLWLTGGPGFNDLTCGLRGMTDRAARALDLYGDYFHRFIIALELIEQGYVFKIRHEHGVMIFTRFQVIFIYTPGTVLLHCTQRLFQCAGHRFKFAQAIGSTKIFRIDITQL